MIEGLDNYSEEEWAHLKTIQDRHLHIVLVISGCIAAAVFLPFLFLYLGLKFFAPTMLTTPWAPGALFATKIVFVAWMAAGTILGFYLGSRILARSQPGYTFGQAFKDYFRSPKAHEVIGDYRQQKGVV